MDYGETVEKIMSTGAEVVFNTIVPPGVVPFFEQLHKARGPAEMVPGQHHVRMNVCIGHVRDGAIKTVKSLGVVDPDEAMVEGPGLAPAS